MTEETDPALHCQGICVAAKPAALGPTLLPDTPHKGLGHLQTSGVSEDSGHSDCGTRGVA